MIEEFKQDINNVIQQRLIESECQPQNIEQWYEKAANLDRQKKRRKEIIKKEKNKSSCSKSKYINNC